MPLSIFRGASLQRFFNQWRIQSVGNYYHTFISWYIRGYWETLINIYFED